MIEHLLAAFKENLLEFEAVKANTDGVFWLSKKNPIPGVSTEDVENTFSYVSTLSECFSDLISNTGVPIKVFIERYGGYGITKNGGGSRTLIINECQVKGSGANYLSGRGATHWHSHGALNISDAVLETIYTLLVNKITPRKAATIYSIIKTGPKSAYFTESLEEYNAEPCWGALLIRETCIRPAHFHRAMFFEPKEEYRDRITPDVARMRRLWKELKLSFPDSRRFAVLLSDFALKSAEQFGFCRAARLAHGCITPSNLAIDGRWLDLTTCSFMDSGKNYMVTPTQAPAFTEYEVIKQILVELAHNYSKYTNQNLNVFPILNLYENAFEFFFHRHCSYVFGIPASLWPIKGKLASCDFIVSIVKKLILRNTDYITQPPCGLNDADPILHLLEFVYCPDEKSNVSATILSEYGIDLPLLQRSFKELLQCCYKSLSWSSELVFFRHACLITSMRRFYFSTFFYSGYLRKRLEKSLLSNDLLEMKGILDQMEGVIEWAFDEIDPMGNCTLLPIADENWIFSTLDGMCSTGASQLSIGEFLSYALDCHPGIEGADVQYRYLQKLSDHLM